MLHMNNNYGSGVGRKEVSKEETERQKKQEAWWKAYYEGKQVSVLDLP